MFVISKEIHGLKYGGSFQISTTIPSGYQTSRAVNSRIGPGRGAAYRFQILGESCTTTETCQEIFQQYGTSGDAVNSRIHDLNTDSTFEFELSSNPTPANPPVVPVISDTPNNSPQEPGTQPSGDAPSSASITKFLASSTLVNAGDEISIEWVTGGDVTVCIASSSNPTSEWNGVKFTSGIESGIVVNRSSVFDIECSGPGGSAYRFVEVQTREDKPFNDINIIPGNTPPNIPDAGDGFANPSGGTDGSNSGITPAPKLPTLNCKPSKIASAKNLIQGSALDVLDILDCDATDGSTVEYEVIKPNQVHEVYNGLNSRFVPQTSGSYRIRTISQALEEEERTITINVFDPVVQEVSP